MNSIELNQLIRDIGSYSSDGIVFSEMPDGNFNSTSASVVIDLTNDELAMPLSEISQRRCPGKYYFLEVEIIQGMLEEFFERKNEIGAFKIFVKRVIKYAENDA